MQTMPNGMPNSPTTNPAFYGGTIFNISTGLNWAFSKSGTFGVEVGTDLYEDLEGPQMQSDFFANISLMALF